MKSRFESNLHLFSRFSEAYLDVIRCLPSKPLPDEIKPSVINQQMGSIAIYGIGQGLYFEALVDWLKQSSQNQLVFVEDDLLALKSFLESERAEKILSHPQVHIALLKDKEACTASYAVLTHDFLFLSLPSRQAQADKIYIQLLQDVYNIHAYLAELWLYKEQANIYFHLAHLDEYLVSKEIEKTLNLSTFIICGAGPSLENEIEQLKQPKGVLIASGTALNLLNDREIRPHLGVVFDGKVSGLRRLQSLNGTSIPFLIDLDATEGVRYIQGPKILTRQRDLAKWKIRLLSELGIEDKFLLIGPCVSSTHYALEAAIALKANEIMFLGVDLSYVKGKHYPGRITWLQDADDPTPIKRRKDLFYVQELAVSRLFFKEAAIYSQIAKENPHIKFLNGSNSGQSIHGFIPFNYSELKGNTSVLNFKCEPFDIPLESIKHLLIHWKQTLQRSPELLLEGYIKRLEMKFAAYKKYYRVMKKPVPKELNHSIEIFCKKIVEHHLMCVDKALKEVEEKIASPKSSIPFPEKLSEKTLHTFYDNGQLKNFIEYSKGKRNGIYRFYSRLGLLLEEGYYQNGVPFGLYRQWDREGRIELEIFSHGDGTFDLTEWNSKGQMIRQLKSGHLIKEEVESLKKSLDSLLKELP